MGATVSAPPTIPAEHGAAIDAWFALPKRVRGKRLATVARTRRAILVAVAGHHERTNPADEVFGSPFTTGAYGRSVSVPRSLRSLLGRYVGGGK